jgi:hypothetical protein
MPVMGQNLPRLNVTLLAQLVAVLPLACHRGQQLNNMLC